MKRTQQLDFFTPRSARQLQEHARRTEHGGDIRKGKRKLARPFDQRRPIHLTLRSERARGDLSMLKVRRAEAIDRLVKRLAAENRIKIYQYANSGNHLHLLLHAKDHRGFKRFLRTLGALVARLVTGAKKGNPTGKFWTALAWTRIVNWGRHLFNEGYYVIQNELEAEGLVSYSDRAKSRRQNLKP
jgi:REP element-mobilizing transposase RayT